MIKVIRGFTAVAATLGGLLFSTAGHAQIPVTDATSISQQIMQVAAWAQQYKQMIDQLQNQLAQIKAITGSRGMSLVASVMDRQDIPPDYLTLFDQLRNGGVTGATKAIYNAAKVYDCGERFPNNDQERKSCEALTLAAPQNIDLMNTSIKASKKRQDQIRSMLASVDTTEDAKAAADLQNRIQIEVALLNNEKQMMDMAANLQKEQLALSQTQAAELATKSLTRTANKSKVNPFNLQ